MPSSITDYGEDYFAGMIFGATSVQPLTYWLALCAQVPDRSGDGTTLVEPDVADGYSRVQFNNNGTVFGLPAGGVVANILPIDFGIVTGLDWPVINSYALCDAQTAGNVYLYGTLRVPRAPVVGHQVSFDAGLLTFSVNPISPTIIPAA